MESCSFTDCTMTAIKAKTLNKNIRFFPYPKLESLRQIWVDQSQRYFVDKNSTVCSLHFMDEDFEKDVEHKAIGVPNRLILKEGAIPSTEHAIFLEQVPSRNSEVQKPVISRKTFTLGLPPMVQKIKSIGPAFSKLQAVNVSSVLRVNASLQKEIAKQHEVIERYRHKIILLQNYCNWLKSQEIVAKQKLDVFEEMFSKAQLDLVCKKKKRVQWSDEDMINAWTLKYTSGQAYNFVKENLKYPLPAPETLKRWVSKMTSFYGYIDIVYKFLEMRAKDLSDKEKLVVLQYDTMKLPEMYESDGVTVASIRTMLAVNASSLIGDWKQPVYVNYKLKMSPVVLQNIIMKLYDVGYTVVACVSDCTPHNIALWTAFNLNHENTSFQHPATKTNIYFFPDASHLLKLVRDCLLDSEIDVEGKIIDKTILQRLINESKGEVKRSLRINRQHLLRNRVKTRDVGLAAELLSQSTAIALMQCFPDDIIAQYTAEFIQLVNNWFNVMNSNVPAHPVRLKCPYGKYITEQNETLDAMYQAMSCEENKTLQLFQKGILMSINSLRNLYSEVYLRYQVTDILTNRLNKRALENLFSEIIHKGSTTGCTPLEALQQLIPVFFGKSSYLMAIRDNLEDCDEPSTSFDQTPSPDFYCENEDLLTVKEEVVEDDTVIMD